MRFCDWDVLVFPGIGDTTTPLQEFRTTCTVIESESDNAHCGVNVSSTLNPICLSKMPSMVPMVSCFIPSLSVAVPFRISLHNWGTSAFGPTGAAVEICAIVDGALIGTTICGQGGCWPQAIGTLEGSGALTFPPFHSEILEQAFIDPTDDHGRIKISVSEGTLSTKQKFSKHRTLVVFSFQHAPLNILEDAGIAWPNPRMWHQMQMQVPYTETPGPVAAYGQHPLPCGSRKARLVHDLAKPHQRLRAQTDPEARFVLHPGYVVGYPPSGVASDVFLTETRMPEELRRLPQRGRVTNAVPSQPCKNAGGARNLSDWEQSLSGTGPLRSFSAMNSKTHTHDATTAPARQSMLPPAGRRDSPPPPSNKESNRGQQVKTKVVLKPVSVLSKSPANARFHAPPSVPIHESSTKSPTVQESVPNGTGAGPKPLTPQSGNWGAAIASSGTDSGRKKRRRMVSKEMEIDASFCPAPNENAVPTAKSRGNRVGSNGRTRSVMDLDNLLDGIR